MLLVSSVPCQPHFEVIGCSLCYLKGTPKNGLLYKPSFLYLLWVLVMLIGVLSILIDNPHLTILAIVPLLKVVLLFGAAINKWLLPVLVVGLSTVLWLILLLKCYDLLPSSRVG